MVMEPKYLTEEVIVDLNHPLTRWARIPREAQPSIKQIFHTMSPCEGLRYVHFRNITKNRWKRSWFLKPLSRWWSKLRSPRVVPNHVVALFFAVLPRTTIRGNMVYVSIISSSAWRPTVQRWHQKSYISRAFSTQWKPPFFFGHF